VKILLFLIFTIMLISCSLVSSKEEKIKERQQQYERCVAQFKKSGLNNEMSIQLCTLAYGNKEDN